MKRMTLWMGILILCLALVSVSQAVTYHVNAEEGNDSWNGLSATHTSGITGPKQSINSAIAAASPGDVVSVAAVNSMYGDVNVSKNLTFTSVTGSPRVSRWTSNQNHTLTGPFRIEYELNLLNGQITGATNLTMRSSTTPATFVKRTSGTVDAQINFEGPVDFIYGDSSTPGVPASITTGGEITASSDTSNFRNFTNHTTVVLGSSKRMNGVLMTNADFDLGGNTLAIVGVNPAPAPGIVHNLGGNILNGTLDFTVVMWAGLPLIPDSYVTVYGNGYDLPDVTATSRGPLTLLPRRRVLVLDTTGSIGVVTATDGVDIEIYDAGAAGESIAGLVQSGSRTLLISRNSPGSYEVLNVTGTLVSNGTGMIDIDRTGQVTLGGVDLTSGTVEFDTSLDNNSSVIITGNASFVGGFWNLAFDKGAKSQRKMHLRGAQNYFSSQSTRTDFSFTRNAPGITHGPVWLVVDGSVQQFVTGNSMETIWWGPIKVENSSTTSPAVVFQDGVFRLLAQSGGSELSLFNTGNGFPIKLDNCTLIIGGETSPFIGDGSFRNDTGFITENGGRVSMNGDPSYGSQNVRGLGDFGAFEVNAVNGIALLHNDIKLTDYLYLTKGTVLNDADDVNPRASSFNLSFLNNTTSPTIVRNEGALAEAPIFTSPVNVIYIGNDKVAGFEVPTATNKLVDFSVETTNGLNCPGHGTIILQQNTWVNGVLNINDGQALVIDNGFNLHLNGPTVNLAGDLVSLGSGALVLRYPTGTTLQGPGALPSIRVAAGSNNNFIDGSIGLADGLYGPDGWQCSGDEPVPSPVGTGDLTFNQNTAPGQTSSLIANFMSSANNHLDILRTHAGATLTLQNNLNQGGNFTHRTGGTIELGEFTHSIAGTGLEIQGLSSTTSTTGKLAFVESATTNLTLTLASSKAPVIDANVDITLNAAATVFRLATGSSSDTLIVNGDFTLNKGTVQLGSVGGATPKDLWLQGHNFYLGADGSIVGDGVLYLNGLNLPAVLAKSTAVNPVINVTIEDSPTLTNVTQISDVILNCVGGELKIAGIFFHKSGLLDFDSCDIIILASGQYQRDAGSYLATDGYLILQTAAVDVGINATSPDFEIDNLRIEAGQVVPVTGGSNFTIRQRFDLFNGVGANAFQHGGRMSMADGVVFTFKDGTLDQAPTYVGSIDLVAVHTRDLPLPTVVWPATPASLVNIFTAAPTGNFELVLPGSRTVNTVFNLTHGTVTVPTGATFTVVDNAIINVVDGILNLAGTAQTAYGNDITVNYYNNAANYTTGPELPAVVKRLLFSRYVNAPNTWTIIKSEVKVTSGDTLIIRNNVQADEQISVEGDVLIESEQNVFSQATPPVCVFNAPLCFTGDQNQIVKVPKGGIDLRPPVPGLIPPPPGPARIKIAKDSPSNTVKVTGGDLRVDHISFCNGLLDTDDDNSVQIPAPAPGLGQGFDRDCMEAGNISHAIGRITKKFMNAEIDAWSSNERQEFPVGSNDTYRPMAFTFRNEIGQVTIPHSLELTTQHVDTPPRGSQGIPMADNCGVTTNTYAPFYWHVESNGSYTQESYDVEVKASGLKRDADPSDGIDGYHNVDNLRILRRHGNISEIDNSWIMQGDCADYDNAQYTEGPTVINEHAKGGLRAEGAIFTVGMPYGDLPVAKHFADRIVWDGNPYNAMTFYVTHADFWPGKPLQPGDEIAVYDGSSCVGFVKLTQKVTPDNYAIIVASKDDDPMDNVTNGYKEGNSIYFRYWDSKTDTEYSVPETAIEYYKVGVEEREYDVVFEQRSTRVELFKGEPRIGGQEIWLTKGWNIFSLAVDPYDPDIDFSNYVLDTNSPNIFGNGILNSIEPQLVKVQDERGNTIEVIFGNWQDDIEEWEPTEGYYVKVTEDVKLEVLSNTLISSPTTIGLVRGWNIISYPCLEAEQDAIDVLQPLIDLGVLDKAMDQYGHALERLAFVTQNNGWYNGIGTMQAGQGYYIKLNNPATLELSCPGQDIVAKPLVAKVEAQPKHFARDWGNPYMPMNIYLNDAVIGGQSLAVGDEVAVYDGDKLVGSVVVEHAPSKENPLALVAGMDDGSGQGFAKGSSMIFKIWKSDVNQQVEISSNEIRFFDDTGSESGSQGFEPRATATISINSAADVASMPTAFELNQNYPNPFNPSTTISFAVPTESIVKVQVFDITGKLVTTLVNTNMSAGLHNVEWTGTDSNGQRVATGIYFYKMTAGNFVQSKKMLFAK